MREATLSDRVRAGSEAAPWVVDEIIRLESELKQMEADVVAEHQAAVDMFAKFDDANDKLKVAEEALAKWQAEERSAFISARLYRILAAIRAPAFI